MTASPTTAARLITGAAFALAFVLAGPSAADPSDPICIVPPADYCSNFEGHTFGSPGYRECFQRATEAQWGEYCNPFG